MSEQAAKLMASVDHWATIYTLSTSDGGRARALRMFTRACEAAGIDPDTYLPLT